MRLDINFKYSLNSEFLVDFVSIYFKMTTVFFKHECAFRNYNHKFKSNDHEIRMYFFTRLFMKFH